LNASSRWPLCLTLWIWILGEIPLLLFTPFWMMRWCEIGTAAQNGLPGWRLLLAWGTGSRMLHPASETRQAFLDGCGAATLAVLLRTQGIQVPQTLLWSLTRQPTGGTTLWRMAQIGRRFGGSCSVHRRVPRNGTHEAGWDLALPLPGVVHLKRAHFVVLLRLRPRTALLLDPAHGLIQVPRESLRRQASGLALTCSLPPLGTAWATEGAIVDGAERGERP